MSLDITHITNKIAVVNFSPDSDQLFYLFKNSEIEENTTRIYLENSFPSDHPLYAKKNVIHYNLDTKTQVVAAAETLEQIYRSYFLNGKFDTPNVKIGNWAIYNQESNSYFIRFDYVLSTKVDYTNVPTCKYLTVSDSEFLSDFYQYANKSKGTVCSHPTLHKNSSSQVNYCSMIFDHPCNCSGYEKDSKTLFTYTVTSNVTNVNFIYSAVVSRFSHLIKVSIINETNNNEPVIEISLTSLNGFSYENINSEAELLMQQVLSTYSDSDYAINLMPNADLSAQPVKIKSSYISSLI